MKDSNLTKQRKLVGFMSAIFGKAHAVGADNTVNTVVVNTGTVTDDGTASKLDNNVRAVWSKEIAFKALPNLKFLQFAKIKKELGVEPGLTIKMIGYNNIKRGGKLTEGSHIKTNGMSNYTKEITVAEYGNALGFSELSFRTSFTNLMDDASKLLADDYAITMDLMLRDVALASANVIYARKQGEAQPANRDALKDGLTVTTIKDCAEFLNTKNTPKFEGDYYIGMIHPHQARTIQDDPEWIDTSKYAQPQNIFKGEIGRVQNVRFIETTVMPNGDVTDAEDPAYDNTLLIGADGSKKAVYQSVIFGEEYYGYAEALPVELRDNGVTDFGRHRALAWYTICGAGILNANRGIRVETL